MIRQATQGMGIPGTLDFRVGLVTSPVVFAPSGAITTVRSVARQAVTPASDARQTALASSTATATVTAGGAL